MLSPSSLTLSSSVDSKATAVLNEAVKLSDIILFERVVGFWILLFSCALASIALSFNKLVISLSCAVARSCVAFFQWQFIKIFLTTFLELSNTAI